MLLSGLTGVPFEAGGLEALTDCIEREGKEEEPYPEFHASTLLCALADQHHCLALVSDYPSYLMIEGVWCMKEVNLRTSTIVTYCLVDKRQLATAACL